MYEDLKKQFIIEVKELLNKTQEKLLLLEKDQNNKQLIEDIFRSMHTIKGAAGIYGYENLSKLAHSFENIFSIIRDKLLKVNNNIITVALSAIDVMFSIITNNNIDNTLINNLIDKLNNIISKSSKNTKSTEKQKVKLNTYYILFEPNADIEERGIKIKSILSDFENFEFKIITELTDKERIQKNKYPKFYEIIVATKYSAEDLKAIFLFTPKEVKIIKIIDLNLFENKNFVDFYNKAIKILPSLSEREKLIKNYANIVKSDTHNNKEKDLKENKDSKQTNIINVFYDQTQNLLEYIKIPSRKLDELLSLTSELIINNSQLKESAKNNNSKKIKELSENITKIINNIKETTLNLRLIEINSILPPYYRLVRDLSKKFNKKIEFIPEGTDTHIDKTILDKLSNPLMHILRNAIDHGIETPQERKAKGKGEKGIIRFITYQSNANIIIQIQDDGRGIDLEQVKQVAIEKGFIQPETKLSTNEIYDLLFYPGFTMSKRITEISGRGVGMDAIKQAILDLRGDIEIDSEINLGTSITIKLPITLSILETLHFSAANINFLIPISNIKKTDKVYIDKLRYHSGKRVIINDEIIPYFDINKLLGIENNNSTIKYYALINNGRKPFILFFDKIHGEYQAVIKNLGPVFKTLDIFIGASILANGDVAYILDTHKVQKKFFSYTNLN